MTIKRKKQHVLSEKRAGVLYGRCVPFSGARADLGKSDIIGLGPYEGLRGENKWTAAKSYSLKLETIQKIMTEAAQEQQEGFLRIDFDGKTYCLVEERLFLRMAQFEGE